MSQPTDRSDVPIPGHRPPTGKLPSRRVGRCVVIHRVVACRVVKGPQQHIAACVVLGRKLVPGGMIRPCSFGGKGCRRTLRRGAVGRRYDAVNRVRRCGQKIGEVGGRFVFRKRRQRHFPCRCRSLRNRRTAPRLRKRRRSDYWNLRCARSYVAYARCGNSRGRVWSRTPPPVHSGCQEKSPIVVRFSVFCSILIVASCPLHYYIRELENFF